MPYTKDGDEYPFVGFEGGQTQKLNALLAYKEIYGPLVTVSDDWRLGYLDSVAEDQNMTPEEEALLYELFDQVP